MITVNRREEAWVEGMTVKGMLERLNFKFPLIIVKIDGVLVKREDYGSTPVPDGADVSALHLISGG
ncbi:MAG: sulfur carrier protein ThiS [Thermoplasmata archaeon]|nr:sulfur carrier protein ThiS [Thermoplasmata archaeon]